MEPRTLQHTVLCTHYESAIEGSKTLKPQGHTCRQCARDPWGGLLVD